MHPAAGSGRARNVHCWQSADGNSRRRIGVDAAHPVGAVIVGGGGSAGNSAEQLGGGAGNASVEQLAAGRKWRRENGCAVDVLGDDELGQWADSFNRMTTECWATRTVLQAERVRMAGAGRRLAMNETRLFPLQLTVENWVRARSRIRNS